MLTNPPVNKTVSESITTSVMFQVGERKRSRRTLEVEKPSTRRRLDVENITENAPLRGAVVCLTGLPADEKTRLHRHVEQLGGRFVFIVSCIVSAAPRRANHPTHRSLGHSYQQLHSRLGYVQDNTSYCKRRRGRKISYSRCLSDDSSRFPRLVGGMHSDAQTCQRTTSFLE